MPRSSTIWAAVLLLASFSGSGPLLTTAEAMPAPGPQQTQGRPMYYFPRHVKRAIVTNHTEPAAPSPTPAKPAKSSSSEQLQLRPGPDLTSFINPIAHSEPQVPSSSAPLSSAASSLPKSSERLSRSSHVREPPALVSPPSSPPPDNQPLLRPSAPVFGSTGRNPEVILTSSADRSPLGGSSSGFSQAVLPTSSLRTLVSRSEMNSPVQGSTGGLPETIVPPTSAAASSAPIQSSDGGLVSSVLAPSVGSTVAPPLSAPQPTSSVQNLVSRSELNDPVQGSTGSLPETIVSATSAAPSSAASPASDGGLLSSLLDPLIGSTGVAPVPVVQPTSAASSPANAPVSSPVSSADAPVSSSLAESIVLGPFIVAGSSTVAPSPTPIASTGGLPSTVVPASSTPDPPASQQPQLSSQGTGIVVGMTTAFTPTAPAASATPTPDPGLLSSILSEVPAILPSATGFVTTAPTPIPSGIVPPALSSMVSDLPGLLSSAVSELPPSALPSLISQIISDLPTPSVSFQITSLPTAFPTASDPPLLSSLPIVLPSESIPTPVSSIPLVLPTSEIVLPSGTAPLSITPIITPTPLPSGILPSSGIIGTSAAVDPTLSVSPSNIPASEIPPSSVAAVTASSAVLPTGNPINSNSATLTIPSLPSVTSKLTPVMSLAATATDSQTAMVIGTSIIQAQSPTVAPSATPSSIPASLPKLIAPPGGVPSDVSQDTFMGQICFNYKLNYEFVAANDGGNQIFHYLPIAISDALNISVSDVKNYGLKAYDTLKYQGFITTISLFTIPKDLESTLAAQLRNPMDSLWHNQNPVVNSLTDLINTACPLPAGKTPSDVTSPNQVVAPVNPSSVGNGDGSALGGDIGASRKVNSTSAIVASSAIVGAFAYGAAMFFVARRYRNKRIAHQRTSSVPSMSRMTYGSIPGGAAAWMHGARNGRLTPGSRGSHGSSSTQGHSVRTQQISAPVMAENSLGWN